MPATQPAPDSPAIAVPEACVTLPRRSKPSRPHKKRPEELQIRREMVLLRSVVGMRTTEIAKELRIGVETVRSDLKEARRSNLIVAARDQIMLLVPKAIATLEAHLDNGDKDVALLVLEGLGVIGKHMQITMASPLGAKEDTFYEFRARVLQTKQAGTSPVVEADPRPTAQITGAIVDAEIETSRGKDAGGESMEGRTL